MATSDAILETKDLTKKYGELTAVDSVSVSLFDDEICAIIGPNGAGKTTFFDLLTGGVLPTSGQITFDGADITTSSPHAVVRQGLSRSFQVTNIFSDMSVYENIQVSLFSNNRNFDIIHQSRNLVDLNDRAQELLKRVGLEEQGNKEAGSLSHGDQRRLEIALTLGKEPDLLLLDEPTSGMSPTETEETIALLEELADSLPMVVIEHKMNVVKSLADRIVVLHNGMVLEDGEPMAVQESQRVQEVYLSPDATV